MPISFGIHSCHNIDILLIALALLEVLEQISWSNLLKANLIAQNIVPKEDGESRPFVNFISFRLLEMNDILGVV